MSNRFPRPQFFNSSENPRFAHERAIYMPPRPTNPSGFYRSFPPERMPSTFRNTPEIWLSNDVQGVSREVSKEMGPNRQDYIRPEMLWRGPEIGQPIPHPSNRSLLLPKDPYFNRLPPTPRNRPPQPFRPIPPPPRSHNRHNRPTLQLPWPNRPMLEDPSRQGTTWMYAQSSKELEIGKQKRPHEMLPGLFAPKMPRIEDPKSSILQLSQNIYSILFSQFQKMKAPQRIVATNLSPQRASMNFRNMSNSPRRMDLYQKVEMQTVKIVRPGIVSGKAGKMEVEKARVQKEFFENNHDERIENEQEENEDDEIDEDAPDEDTSDVEISLHLQRISDLYPLDYPHLVLLYTAARLGQVDGSKEGDLATCGLCAGLGHRGKTCARKAPGKSAPLKATNVIKCVANRLKQVNDQVIQQRKKGTFDPTKAEMKPEDEKAFILAVKKLFLLPKIKPHSLKVCNVCGQVGHTTWSCGGKNKTTKKLKAIRRSKISNR